MNGKCNKHSKKASNYANRASYLFKSCKSVKDTNQKMSQAVDHAKSELLKVRTGRANPDLLNSIQVDYYGTLTPLNQVSTITIPEPRMIALQPFEKTLIPIIEKAIMV